MLKDKALMPKESGLNAEIPGTQRKYLETTIKDSVVLRIKIGIEGRKNNLRED